MTSSRRIMLALVVSLVVTTWFSWPLFRHVAEGIPSSPANIELNNVRTMISGDHLQFLYHMWLGMDTFTGKTPLFYNLYEFNAGDDEARREVRPYYLPFSLFFTLGALSGNQALGWNVAIYITIWLTYWFSWLLMRRYIEDDFVAAVLALLPVGIPFVWIVLMGGSPTGFSMMWVPLLLYGIDRWVVQRSMAGAALTGAVIFFSEWSDTHVFFFCVLLTPAWIIVTYIYRLGIRWPRRDEILGWLRSAWPLMLFALLVAFKAWSVRQGLQDTAIASGRSLHEVDLFSHGLRSLVTLTPQGDSSKIYVGYYGLLVLACAAVWSVFGLVRRPADHRLWAALMVLAGIALIFWLSTGTKNPLGPRFWQAWTKLIPPYGMIRQPDKIFCILPTLIAVFGAMTLSRMDLHRYVWRKRIMMLLILVPLLWDAQARINPTICLLDEEQGAYAAVVEVAAERGEVPRALALPLWPGDSHWSSVYQYYASLYRIRMVNGYRPTARKAYVESIFEPYSPMNAGYPSDYQLDGLLAMGVRHLLLHEDAFPEKVSSFPVGATLANLMDHPRLEFRARDESVWCFSIREKAVAGSSMKGIQDQLSALFPVRIWNWASSAWPEESKIKAEDAIGGRYVRVDAPMEDFMPSRFIRTGGTYPMAWHVRVRGRGAFELHAETGEKDEKSSHRVDCEEWTWLRISSPAVSDTVEQTASIKVTEGDLDLDALILTRADWASPAVGASIRLPAAAFFRAGYTLDDFSGVTFRARRDLNAVIMYARHLYLEAGEYEVRLNFETGAPDGTRLGSILMSSDGADEGAVPSAVLAGQPAILLHRQPDNRFFSFAFDYARTADLTARDVIITRLR